MDEQPDEQLEAWRYSSGSTNWRLSGPGSLSMDADHLQHLSGSFLKLSVSPSNSSMRSIPDIDTPDDHATIFPNGPDENSDASASTLVDGPDLSVPPPPGQCSPSLHAVP